jgi:hypothetical protein
MTGQVKMFTSLVDDAGDHEQVSFGDNSKGRISGLGEISLTNDLSLFNVLFVDFCSYNFLSIAQFCDLGLSCTFDDEGVTITYKKANEVVFKGFCYVNLYLVDFESHEANLTTCLISKTSKGWLWHRRIAHIGMIQLKKAFKKGMVLGVKDVTFEKDKLCTACQSSKQVASHHPMKAYVSTTRPLELIHRTSLDQLHTRVLVVISIVLSLLMITHAILGHSFWRTRARHLTSSRSFLLGPK